MNTTIEPKKIVVEVNAQHAVWMPTKERAIEMAFGWLSAMELDASQWRETGAHENSDHSWIVGLAPKEQDATRASKG